MVSFKKIIALSILALLLSDMKVYAQEPNFSMYLYTPFFTNPGSIGVVEDARLMLNYRNQAVDVGESFQSSSLSGYYPLYLGNHRLVLAGSFLNDQVSNFTSTNGGLLGLASSIRITTYSELSFGMQAGYLQRGRGGDFITDDQFVNGVFDPDVVSGDAVLNQTKGYATLSTGLYYLIKDDRGKEKAFFGGSIFNATRPNVSLVESIADRLPASVRATAGYRVYQGLKLSVIPSLRWVNQTGNNFFNIGSRFGYELANSEEGVKKIELGLWYNTNNLGVFSVAYEQSDLTLGVSYDLPVGADLTRTQNGIFELAVSFRLKKISKPYLAKQMPQKTLFRRVKRN
ncbi:MAG: PorP/SprF family type IX secretion system membrane protein [Cyclobacteriaceae bacterium]